MQSMAMVFERSDGRWKLAAAVNRPARGWPALCTEGAPPTAPPALAAADYAPELARVLTHATTGNQTLALPLAGGRGFWMIGILTQTGHYASAAGLRAKNWPDGHQVATPRPAVVHHETDTFITTYTAIDPTHPAGKPAAATLTLDGFFGWPLSAVAS
jgi:hypothetical protein